MWKELTGYNLELSDNMLEALNHLNKVGYRPSDIKIQSYPSVKIFYYEYGF